MSSDKEILALEDNRYAAMCGGDFAALEAMLHDELLYTHSSGLTDLGGTPLVGSPAEFGKLIVEETEKWAKVIKFAGIKSE